MRVLVDFTQIPVGRTGVGVYADHLVENLQRILSKEDALILVVQSDDRAIRASTENRPNVHLVTIPSALFRNRILLSGFEQVALPILAKLKRADVIHSLHYTHPLLALTPRVVTIHDLTHILFPEMHTRARGWIMPFFFWRTMKHAEAVIFVSKSTQMDAERICPRARNLHYAVPLGVSTAISNDESECRSNELLEGMGVAKPYLLFIGTLEPRKNVVRIVRAFERVAEKHPNLTLVVAGKLGWHTEEIVAAMETSPMRTRIRYLGFVSEAQKSVLLRGCEILVYPSLYEGFGLPVLEGMVAGAPVITGNVSSMPEVAGDAALLVDPTSVDEIAAAMQRVLDEAGLAKHLREAGREQVKLFTWSSMAEKTLGAYKSVIARSA